MKLSICLAQVLGYSKNCPRGEIKRICDETGLERHQVSDLLHNRAQYVSLPTLARLCNYLIQYRQIDPRSLPGALFSRDPEGFWELLADRHQLELCIGVRHADKFERLFVVMSDSYLQGELLHNITSRTGTAVKHVTNAATADHLPNKPARQHLEFRLVSAPSRLDDPPSPYDLEAIRREAEDVYSRFAKNDRDRALVGLGSIKVNPVVELILANAFQAQPFESQDTVARPRDRACPFLFRYRVEDAKPPSCCGGMRLSEAEAGDRPGIYYETASGKWACCPWDGKHDAALVFYAHHIPQRRLEMVLAGFSGRGTQCLANFLRDTTVQLWPPSYDDPELRIGAFVIQFTFKQASREPGTWAHDRPASTRVIPLSADVLRRRLDSGRG